MHAPVLRLALAVLVAALVSGCDLPTDPVPTNPYDPLFDGPRIPTSPTDLVLASSTTSSVSLSWTDESTFETGFEVQARVESGTYATIATLPANATTYTDAGIASTTSRSYRIVARLGSTKGVARDTLDLRFPRERTELDALRDAAPGATQAVFSDDGGVVYVRTPAAVWAADAQTVVALCGDASGETTVLGVWAPTGGAPRQTVALPVVRGLRLALASDGRRAIVSGVALGSGRTLVGVDVAGAAVLWGETLIEGADFDITFSPDGSRVADATPQVRRLRAAATGDVLASVTGAFDRPDAVAFSPGGEALGLVLASRVPILSAATFEQTFELSVRGVQGLRLLGPTRAAIFVNNGGRYVAERYNFTSAWEVALPEASARGALVASR